MLFNEPKLLKSLDDWGADRGIARFSALQRAEIAEIVTNSKASHFSTSCFSALQRAEIAEIDWEGGEVDPEKDCFSALQRAEIAEISILVSDKRPAPAVSVLFNEPKLLKSKIGDAAASFRMRFSALQRAEIAEIGPQGPSFGSTPPSFSALQRAEIAEIYSVCAGRQPVQCVSVLFNEPKLLKYRPPLPAPPVSQIPIPARRRS